MSIFLNLKTDVKIDFCTNLHKFLCDLTDFRYKMLGLTVLYVPLEGYDLNVEEASGNKDLAKRLELVLSHWLNQIKIAISDKEQLATYELLCLVDEYDFWTYRR